MNKKKLTPSIRSIWNVTTRIFVPLCKLERFFCERPLIYNNIFYIITMFFYRTDIFRKITSSWFDERCEFKSLEISAHIVRASVFNLSRSKFHAFHITYCYYRFEALCYFFSESAWKCFSRSVSFYECTR